MDDDGANPDMRGRSGLGRRSPNVADHLDSVGGMLV